MTDEKTEFCWSCRQQKPISQIDMTEGNYNSGICKDCQSEQDTKLNASGAKIIERSEGPIWSGWYCKDVIYKYVSVQANGKTLPFIRRFTAIDAHYETTEIFRLVNQFIANGYQYLKYYGDLELLKQKDFWWYIEKFGDFYKFGGNCFEYSNAFSLETLSIQQIFELIEVWTPLPESLKQHILKQLDDGLVFASNPKAFERKKVLCFKEYTKESREPKITILQGLNFLTQTT